MEVEKHVGPHPEAKMIGNIPYTPRVKKVLVLAGKEAKALNHSYVGTEHILLGLLRGMYCNFVVEPKVGVDDRHFSSSPRTGRE
jgi:hypothetical protein